MEGHIGIVGSGNSELLSAMKEAINNHDVIVIEDDQIYGGTPDVVRKRGINITTELHDVKSKLSLYSDSKWYEDSITLTANWTSNEPIRTANPKHHNKAKQKANKKKKRSIAGKSRKHNR